MKTSEIVILCDLRSQSIKLLRRRLGRIPGGPQLSFTNRMHDFNPGDGTTHRPKRLEAEHGMRNAFDRSVILCHEIIQIFRLPNDTGRLVSPVVVRDRGWGAATLVNCDLLREPLGANRLV